MEQEMMLTKESIEKTLGLYDGGATDSAVAEATGISPAEAKAVADALYLGETERLFREMALAGWEEYEQRLNWEVSVSTLVPLLTKSTQS